MALLAPKIASRSNYRRYCHSKNSAFQAADDSATGVRSLDNSAAGVRSLRTYAGTANMVIDTDYLLRSWTGHLDVAIIVQRRHEYGLCPFDVEAED